MSRATPLIPLGTTGTLGERAVAGHRISAARRRRLGRDVLLARIPAVERRARLPLPHGVRWSLERRDRRKGRAEGNADRGNAAGRVQQRPHSSIFNRRTPRRALCSGNSRGRRARATRPRTTITSRRRTCCRGSARPDEVTWSLGTYTPPERIAQAFKLEKPLPVSRRHVREPAESPRRRGERDERARSFCWPRRLALMAVAVRHGAKRAGVHANRTSTRPTAWERERRRAAFVTPRVRVDRTYVERGARHRTGLSNTSGATTTSPCSPRTADQASTSAARCPTTQASTTARRGTRDRRRTRSCFRRCRPAATTSASRSNATRATPAVRSPTRSIVSRDVPRAWPFLLAAVRAAGPARDRRLFSSARKASSTTRWRESDHPWSTESSDDDDERRRVNAR